MRTTVFIDHSLHCSKRGYTHLRHNEARDTFATLLDEVRHDAEIEAKLQSLKGEMLHKKKLPLVKMTLDLTSKRMDSGKAKSAELFQTKPPNAKSCPMNPQC